MKSLINCASVTLKPKAPSGILGNNPWYVSWAVLPGWRFQFLGKFKIPAGGIAYFDKVGKELIQISKAIDPSAKKIKRQLIRANMIISKHKDWNFERLKAAMKSKGGKLSAVTSRDEYIEQIEKIYNGGLIRSKKIDLVRFANDKSYEEAA